MACHSHCPIAVQFSESISAIWSSIMLFNGEITMTHAEVFSSVRLLRLFNSCMASTNRSGSLRFAETPARRLQTEWKSNFFWSQLVKWREHLYQTANPNPSQRFPILFWEWSRGYNQWTIFISPGNSLRNLDWQLISFQPISIFRPPADGLVKNP